MHARKGERRAGWRAGSRSVTGRRVSGRVLARGRLHGTHGAGSLSVSTARSHDGLSATQFDSKQPDSKQRSLAHCWWAFGSECARLDCCGASRRAPASLFDCHSVHPIAVVRRATSDVQK